MKIVQIWEKLICVEILNSNPKVESSSPVGFSTNLSDPLCLQDERRDLAVPAAVVAQNDLWEAK